jgi:hypothetical protein
VHQLAVLAAAALARPAAGNLFAIGFGKSRRLLPPAFLQPFSKICVNYIEAWNKELPHVWRL